MPTPSVEAAARSTNLLIIDELDYDMSDEVSRFESLAIGLNSDQYHVIRSVDDTHHRGEGGLFFLYGCGGIGKTYLWNTIISNFDLTSTLSYLQHHQELPLYSYSVKKPHT